MSKIPLILQADSYKYSHFQLFPQGTKNNNSYIEARGIEPKSGLHARDTEIVFFGLQMFLREYLSKPITSEDVRRAKVLIESHGLPFNEDDWNIIVDEYDGYFPIVINALEEGTVIKTHTAMVQVQATDDRFAWLASFIETAILRAVWYPTTVATISREAKKIIYKYLKLNSDDPDAEIPFKLHDFGARGVSSSESAQIGGVAHLVNFMGTDTIEALIAAQDYYDFDGAAGFSIPASEHSTITAWERDNELDAYSNMVDKFSKPGALFSCVSDSYDIVNAVDNLWPTLKSKILASGGKLIVRPDSGDPVITPINCVKSLADSFGYTVNSKGYKVINNAAVIQGDGIDLTTISNILFKLNADGYSTSNIAFGMGGALLQRLDRDTLQFAMKTNAIQKEDGSWIDVYKSPMGAKSKISQPGILATFKNQWGDYRTVRKNYLESIGEVDLLTPVFKNGEILRETTLESVRERAGVK